MTSNVISDLSGSLALIIYKQHIMIQALKALVLDQLANGDAEKKAHLQSLLQALEIQTTLDVQQAVGNDDSFADTSALVALWDRLAKASTFSPSEAVQ